MPNTLTNRQEQILDRVQAILVEQLGTRPEKCGLNATFIEDLGCDSLDVVELVMEFEDAFDISITDEEAQKMLTVRDAVVWLDENGATV